MLLYGAILPSYNDEISESAGRSEEVINADDPANRDKVRKLLFS